jgi:hypothetical protein
VKRTRNVEGVVRPFSIIRWTVLLLLVVLPAHAAGGQEGARPVLANLDPGARMIPRGLVTAPWMPRSIRPARASDCMGLDFVNPVRPGESIAFRIAHAARVQLYLFSGLGRLDQVVADRDFGAGEHTVRIDSSIGRGVYAARLIADGSVMETVKLVVAR